jgi:hypothetical protein
MHTIRRFFFWPAFFACQLIGLALVSWHLLAQFHFAYPLGYQLLHLDKHIAEYAPLNNYKHDFELTTPQEHWRLFAAISDGVQSSGKGLREINYTLKNGTTTPLMHEAEIIHLQDVANLIDIFYVAGTISLFVWLALIACAYWQKFTPPPVKNVLLGFLAGFAIMGAILVIIGPTDVFYWLHVQVFPDGHQWFFYYQDSLMTTLMKAPDIFAFIASLLVFFLILLWCICSYGMNRWLNFVPHPSAKKRAKKQQKFT